MAFFKLFKRLKAWNLLLIAVIFLVTFFQVFCTIKMTDYVSSLVRSIQYVEYHNNPDSNTLPGTIYAIYVSCGSSWEAVAELAKTLDNNGETLLGIANASSGDIWANAGFMLLFACSGVLTQILIGIMASRVTASLVTRIREEFYHKVASFSLEEINRFTTASLITRSTNDIEQVQWAVLFGLRMLFSAPITAVWASLRIHAASGSLSWVTVAAVIFIVALLIVVMIFVFPKFKISQQTIDRLNGVTRESILGVRVVRAYNAETYQEEKFDQANKALTKLNLFTSRMLSIFSPTITIVLNGVTLGIYAVGARLLKQGEIAYADVIAFSQLATQVIVAFMMLLMMFLMIPRAMVSAKRIDEILKAKSSILDPENPAGPASFGDIEFKDVSFTYPGGGNPTLSHISFKVSRGDTVAIIGATGSGKTTLVQLLARLYDASSGEVLINGVDIKQQKIESLRAHIGYIPQKGNLFSGTVKSNVLLGLEEEDESRLYDALEVSCSDEFVNQLEGGVEAKIASGGTNVSGGQRQRLCIARAVALHPDIFVFDDSFSALDFKTDRKLRGNLKKSFPNATKVIVAQRVGTIMDADLILVLDQGKVIDQGTHQELLKRCEIYREIALSQLSEKELGL